MASRRVKPSEVPDQPAPRRRQRATTPEARQNQLVAMAYDLAERRIQEGTASAQEVTHFLKLGSTREALEQERLRRENLLLEKKAEGLDAAKRIEQLYEGAIEAMRSYAPTPTERTFDD